MAEYGTYPNDDNQQFREPKVKVSDEDKREPFANIDGYGNQAGLYITSPEDINRTGIAVTIFTDVFT